MSEKRNNQRNKFSLFLLVTALAGTLFTGCDKPNINLNTNNFVSNNNTNIIYVDTFSTNLSTVLLDSFPTAGTGNILIGSYKDPYFGDITSRSFLQISKPSSVPQVSIFAVFDSISLIMRINKSYYGDTLIPQHIMVSQLDTNYQLPLPPLPRTFYNNTNFPYNPTPLGFTDVTIKPTALITSSIATKDSIQIRLPDSLGKSLLNLLYVKSEIVNNNTAFLNYFKGLCLYADNSSKGVIFGFKDSVYLRLVYHEPGASFRYVNVSFPINNATTAFNQITIDRTGTPLSVMAQFQQERKNPNVPTEVPAGLTNHAAYVQSMSGLQAKVNFPSVFTLSQRSDFVGVLKAQLILKPEPGSYSPLLALPKQLIASQTDLNNGIGAPLTLSGQIQYGNLITDYITGQNTQYSYDVTNYIKELLTIPTNQYGLILNIPSPANYTTFNRAVLGDKTNKNFSSKLIIYYISLPR